MSGDHIIELVLSALAGAALGLIYFAGLWFTLRGLDPRCNPFLRLAVSVGLRLGLIVAATLLAIGAGADGRHVLAAFLGFLIMRQLSVMRVRSKVAPIAQHKDI